MAATFFSFSFVFFLCVCSLLTARDVIATRTYMMPKYHSMSAQETRCVNSNMMAYFVFLSSHFSSSFWPVVFFALFPVLCNVLVCKAKKITLSEKNKSAHKTDISKQE